MLPRTRIAWQWRCSRIALIALVCRMMGWLLLCSRGLFIEESCLVWHLKSKYWKCDPGGGERFMMMSVYSGTPFLYRYCRECCTISDLRSLFVFEQNGGSTPYNPAHSTEAMYIKPSTMIEWIQHLPKHSYLFEPIHPRSTWVEPLTQNFATSRQSLPVSATRSSIPRPGMRERWKIKDALEFGSPLYNPPELRRRQVTFHPCMG